VHRPSLLAGYGGSNCPDYGWLREWRRLRLKQDHDLPNGKEVSTAEMVDRLVGKEPGLVTQLCRAVNQYGRDAALASFEQGFKLSRAGGLLPPEEVFDEVVKHC
jgi:hypothetical protein